MKNRNLVETRKLNTSVPTFICTTQCTRSVQKNEINRFYLWAILADVKWNESTCLVSMTVDCLQASFVGKSWRLVRLAHINSNLDYQGVIWLLDNRLFCQKMAAIYHILPILFVSTLAQKLHRWYQMCQLWSVKLCRTERLFKFTFLRQ